MLLPRGENADTVSVNGLGEQIARRSSWRHQSVVGMRNRGRSVYRTLNPVFRRDRAAEVMAIDLTSLFPQRFLPCHPSHSPTPTDGRRVKHEPCQYRHKVSKAMLTDVQDPNTPAIVSLAAGGFAGAVEGAATVLLDL